MTLPLRYNIGSEMRKEGEEYAFKNTKTILNIEQNLDLLTEKMTDFELKLNYVLLRQTKFSKKKRAAQRETTANNGQQVYQNRLINNKIMIRTPFIYLLLTLIVICIILLVLSELILVSDELN